MSLSRSLHSGSAPKNILTWRAGAHDAFQAIVVSAVGVLMMTSSRL